ncbi:GPP34 family phosphoprotein [Streptomyces sp. NBC_01352]|uniref:GPP34 family phosphoprotein n=1 Tax=Streptomyces plumbiresistens TaxID=511811 RepID=A0ABP7T3V7_9ACTN|nr:MULTISPECIES: GPP34 family phosphoprotein [unclassified Streptomyces]MCX4705033.1 GPP34 family phosphoprotein [Streptomyces sp. NBC_01373]
MSTARDLLIVTMDVETDRPVEQGDLSLALAGAELVDLLGASALALDGDRIVPGPQPAPGDRLLDEAAASVVRQEPYESAEEWLWRRGRGLSAAYLAQLETEGLISRERGRLLPVRTGRKTLVDSPDRRRAEDRRVSDEPVLAALTAALGIRDEPAEGFPELTDEAVVTVLATVGDALTELDGVRQRRTVEDAAFDNIWRGL